MKESGWKGVAQSLKRLSVVGRQKLWKLKFWWRGFISCLKETFLVILSGLLIFLLLPLICPSLLLSGFVFSSPVAVSLLPIQNAFFTPLIAQTL